MKLNPEQTRILAKRARYAQMGINYDKATRRFLAEHGLDNDEGAAEEFIDQRPTLKFSPEELTAAIAKAAQT
jgi:hypothetical protein